MEVRYFRNPEGRTEFQALGSALRDTAMKNHQTAHSKMTKNFLQEKPNNTSDSIWELNLRPLD